MKLLDTQLAPLLKFLDGYYAKAPALPKGGRDFLVTAAPWLALIGGLLSFWAAWGVYQAMTWVSAIANNPFYQAYAPKATGFTVTFILSMVVLLALGVLYLLAFLPLKAKNVKGWNLILYGMLLNLVDGVVMLNVGSILGAVIGFAIGYYFLYQVKSYYK
jgi:hypothetical protein